MAHDHWDVIRLWDMSCDQISCDYKYLQAIISIWLKSYYSYLDFVPVSPYSFLYPCSFSSLSTVLYCCTLLSIVDTHCFGCEMWVLLQHTDRALRMMVPTIGYPIGLFVLIACAGWGVAKATACQFAQHGIGSGTALAGVQYGLWHLLGLSPYVPKGYRKGWGTP